MRRDNELEKKQKCLRQAIYPAFFVRIENRNMNHRSMLKTGIIGTVIAAICCFTPLLVVLFGALGLSGLVGLLDIALLPALAFFVLLTIHALWKQQTSNSN